MGYLGYRVNYGRPRGQKLNEVTCTCRYRHQRVGVKGETNTFFRSLVVDRKGTMPGHWFVPVPGVSFCDLK